MELPAREYEKEIEEMKEQMICSLSGGASQEEPNGK
jgi:hypothetical protein